MTTPTPRGRAQQEAVCTADQAVPAGPDGQTEPLPGRHARHKYDADSLRVVAFKVAGREYVADVAQVQEIVRLSDLQRMDNAPEYVEGLLTRRGRLVPVIDLRRRLRVKA